MSAVLVDSLVAATVTAATTTNRVDDYSSETMSTRYSSVQKSGHVDEKCAAGSMATKTSVNPRDGSDQSKEAAL
jgi:hypothetical protein